MKGDTGRIESSGSKEWTRYCDGGIYRRDGSHKEGTQLRKVTSSFDMKGYSSLPFQTDPRYLLRVFNKIS